MERIEPLLKCENCGHYQLYKMLVSGEPYGYSGDIPCLRCIRFETRKDEHTLSRVVNFRHRLEGCDDDTFAIYWLEGVILGIIIGLLLGVC